MIHTTISSVKNVVAIIKYPCLRRGKLTGNIVLFLEPSIGVFLHTPSGPRSVGDLGADLLMENFELLEGTITLENSQ